MGYRVEILGISDFLQVQYTCLDKDYSDTGPIKGLRYNTAIRYSIYNTRASSLFVSLYRIKVVFDNPLWNRILQHEMAGADI